ncbi:hypothetical protein F383_39260 [Gossypium arboreum]|uniref:Uncharacterized protein n=1 Tax=Gossypium arboreum TaxID=29729 RepID=A0A0B0MPT2_GOSAR|nr:hypothetical protein F383_39260 [Gossypium arboreum]
MIMWHRISVKGYVNLYNISM